MSVPVLEQQELEVPRTARELHKWVNDVRFQFSSTEEGKRVLRLRQLPVIKKFAEEVWPLANYAWYFHSDSDDRFFQPVVGNQNFDALLLNQEGNIVRRFEITTAIPGEEGYQDRLRREHLNAYGKVPLTGPKLERDRKTGVVVETTSEPEEATITVAKISKLIELAIDQKLSKNYPANTALIVEFQSHLLKKEKYISSFKSVMEAFLDNLSTVFVEVSLIDDIGSIGLRKANNRA